MGRQFLPRDINLSRRARWAGMGDGGTAEIALKGAFVAQLAPFGPCPRFAKPQFGFPDYPPPPRKYYENNSPRIFLCNFLGAVTAKLRNYQEINSPRIILRNWRPQRPQTCPYWATRNLRNSQEIISRRIFFRNWLRETVAITPKIIPQDFFCVSNFFEGGGGGRERSGTKKAREEIQHKEFWGPQDPPLKIL